MRAASFGTGRALIGIFPSVSAGEKAGPWRRFFDDRPASIALMLILLVAGISVLAPLFTPYGANGIDLRNISSAPTPEHVLGTDELGRDLFTRLLYGGRFSLLVSFLSVLTGAAIGIALGSLAGYFRGAVDMAVACLIDLFLSIPVFLVLLVAASAARGSFWVIPMVIGATSWMETARLVRARLMQLEGEEYVDAARSLGVDNAGIVIRHLLPQALLPVTVSATVGFANAMLMESSLSFLGFGIQPPMPTWGNMLSNAQALLRSSPVAAFAPGLMIFMICLSFNLVGNGIKRALAPREQ